MNMERERERHWICGCLSIVLLSVVLLSVGSLAWRYAGGARAIRRAHGSSLAPLPIVPVEEIVEKQLHKPGVVVSAIQIQEDPAPDCWLYESESK